MADVNVINQIEKIENTVISGLKDFQKATVTRIDQLYRAGQMRVLVSDEVGLGKTLIARGTIAKLAKMQKEAGGILGRVLAPILAENNIECLLCGGQISKSFELFGPALSENLKDVAQPRLIAPAKNITTAPFYGLLASLIQEPSR